MIFEKNDIVTVLNYRLTIYISITPIAQWSVDNISSKKCMPRFYTTFCTTRQIGFARIEPERTARVSTKSRDPVPPRNWRSIYGERGKESGGYYRFPCLKITTHVRDRM